MQTNRSIVQKADFALADLVPGGLMPDAHATDLLRIAVKSAVVMPNMERMMMRSHTQVIDKLRFEGRTLRSATEATALPVAHRSRPTTGKVELNAQKLMAEVRLSFESVEDNIENGRFPDTVKAALGEKLAEELEELGFNGDITSTDDLLKALDGFLIQATTNVALAGGATLQRSVLKDSLKTMPDEFRKDYASLRFYTGSLAAIDYHDTIGDRATPLGDTHVTGPTTQPYAGIEVVGVPVFLNDLGVGSNETVSLLTDPGNMVFGVWRELRMSTDQDVSAEQLILVVSMRVDFKFSHEPAVVQTTGIRAA